MNESIQEHIDKYGFPPPTLNVKVIEYDSPLLTDEIRKQIDKNHELLNSKDKCLSIQVLSPR